MKYLLIWSFVINNHWFGGSAMFPSLSECIESKNIILSYKAVPRDAYVVCMLIDDKTENNAFNMKYVTHRIESQLTRKVNETISSGGGL